jgi:hypothetical protein
MVDTLPDVTENSPELVKVSQKILNRTEIDNQDNISRDDGWIDFIHLSKNREQVEID